METVELTTGTTTAPTFTPTTEVAETAPVVTVSGDAAVAEVADKVNRRKGPRKTDDPAAPYGRKADGTPRGKPGRRPKAA